MARGDYPSTKQDQFVLRFPDGMRDAIKSAAAENGRSMNAEIVARLEAYETGGDAAQEWKQRYEATEASFQRLDKLYNQVSEVALGYREVLATTKAQLLQFAGMVKSLTSIISDLESAPEPELTSLAERMGKAAHETIDRLDGSPLGTASEELEKLGIERDRGFGAKKWSDKQ